MRRQAFFVFYRPSGHGYFYTMATSFYNTPKTAGLVPAYMLDAIGISSGNDTVNFSILLGDETVYSSQLCPYRGFVALDDIASVVLECMTLRSLVTSPLTLVADDTELTLNVLFCKANFGAGFDPQKALWLSSAMVSSHPGAAVALAGLDADKASVLAFGYDRDRKPLSAEASVRPHLIDSCQAHYQIDDIVAAATAGNIVTPLYAVLRRPGCADLTVFLHRHKFFLSFSFRNVFGCTEYVDIPCTVTTKDEYESAVAISAGKAVRYDTALTQSFELTSAPLLPYTMKAVRQLVASDSVRLLTSGGLVDVVISKPQFEDSNDDDSSARADFSFRFATVGLSFLYDDFSDLMPDAGRVFSEQFSNQFS